MQAHRLLPLISLPEWIMIFFRFIWYLTCPHLVPLLHMLICILTSIIYFFFQPNRLQISSRQIKVFASHTWQADMVGRHAGLGVNCLFSVRRLSVTPLYSKRACTFPHIFSLPAKFLPLLDTGLVTTDKETVIVIQVFDTYYCSSLFVSGVYEPCCHCWLPTTTTYQYYHPT